jgi:hypothetical protein
VGSNINKPVSTFMVLPALGWTAFVSAKALADGDDMYLVSAAPAAPVRSHRHSPTPELAAGGGTRTAWLCIWTELAQQGEVAAS